MTASPTTNLLLGLLSTHRRRVPTALAALAIAGLFALLAGVSLHYRSTLMHEAQSRTTRLSFLLAEQAARTFESVDLTLRGFEPLLADPQRRFAAPEIDALLRKRVAELAFVQDIRVVDAGGANLAASEADSGPPIVRQDGCAAALSRPEAAALAIGCEADDRGPAGQAAIAVARRIAGVDGGPARIIVADVDPAYFSQFFGDLDLGARAVVTLSDRQGHMLLASAGDSEGRGSGVIPPTEQARLARLQHSSRDRIVAVQATAGYPLDVLVAIERDTIERQWRQAVTPAALLFVALSGILLFLARNIEQHRTERAQAQQRALVAQKLEAMGQMTASVAHDFRNVLTVMQATLRLIRRRGPEPAVLEEADGTVQRGNAMVDRLLAFSRRADLRPEPHDVNECLRHLEATLRHVAGAEMTLRLDLGEGLPACRMDRTQFDAALMNLVNNARQAMDVGGITTVRSHAEPGGVAVSVSDTGCGIDGATLKRVFEPFFTTKAEHGTGLGLAQVKFFVEQAHGKVTVDSTVGFGTAVTLHLPRASALPDAAAAPSTPVLTLDHA